jgi:hypothetical protein
VYYTAGIVSSTWFGFKRTISFLKTGDFSLVDANSVENCAQLFEECSPHTPDFIYRLVRDYGDAGFLAHFCGLLPNDGTPEIRAAVLNFLICTMKAPFFYQSHYPSVRT